MENSKRPASRQGMAIFAVLSLMVVFTVLGVAAITIAQRDNAASGNVLDIKQREAAAYAGLVYAQNELTRDPDNLLAILKSWQDKTVYASTTGPFVPLYLQFDIAAKVALTTTDPGMFQIPGSDSKIKVEVTGISLPSSSEEPRIALRSTGSSLSGDEQTILGVYQIKNIRMSANQATLPITHPFYVSGGGDWNNTINIIDGNAYFGNNTHLNGSVKDVIIQNAGLRVYGDFTWDDLGTFSVDKDVYINGNFLMHSVKGAVNFKQNLVVTKNLEYASTGTKISVFRSLYVLGNPGFTSLQKEFIDIGTGVGVTDAIFYVPNGELVMGTDSWIRVNGSAFIRKLSGSSAAPFILDVTNRLELASLGLTQTFAGVGSWGQLVARSASATSSIKNTPVSNPVATWAISRVSDGIRIGSGTFPFDSWIGSANFTLGALGDSVQTNGAHVINSNNVSNFFVKGNYVNYLGVLPPTANLSAATTTEGFDSDPAITPRSPQDLTQSLPPSDVNDREPTLDWVTDGTALSKAWTATASTSCKEAAKICGKSIQEAYDANKLAGGTNFHNGFFIVLLAGPEWGWDKSGTETSKLKGKFLFYAAKDMSGSGQPWPTTDGNSTPSNPKNVIFVYGSGPNKIFAGFSPRHTTNPSLPVEFTGYVRYDAAKCEDISWNPETDLTFRGAVHVVGPNPDTKDASRCVRFTINSGNNPNTAKPYLTTFQFDQPALNAIGAAFGNNFVIKSDGSTLPVTPPEFLLMENWVQMRTLGELR